MTSRSCKLEPAIWSRDTGQRIPWFDRCQLIITWMSNIKEVHGKPRLHVCQPTIWSMAAMFGNSVAVVRTHPQAILLAMITMRKSTRWFLFLSYMSMGLRLAAAGAPLLLAVRKMPRKPLHCFVCVRLVAKLSLSHHSTLSLQKCFKRPQWWIGSNTSKSDRITALKYMIEHVLTF